MKNSFALVNRIPPEILSLIPNHWEDGHNDENLIQVTHVCRSWRDIFISRPSLWTRLDFSNADKTRVYIERSKSFSLEICLEARDKFNQNEAFLLAVPHISRLKSLSVSGNPAQLLPILVENFSRHVPLEVLRINFDADHAPTLPDILFNGDLSSLRELTLASVVTPLPWRGLSNLTTFNLCDVPKDKILLNQLLDFFEFVPLRYVHLHDSIPSSRNVPAERVVSLSHLENLSITAQPPHSILLNHFLIPSGAFLRLEFDFSGNHCPASSYLPEAPDRLGNISHIAAVNFCFGLDRRFMRLTGPSGELYVLGNWKREDELPHVGSTRFMRTIDKYDVSRVMSLAITLSGHQRSSPAQITTWTTYHILSRMENLRSLRLVHSKNLPFIYALNPNMNPSEIVLCPKLEAVILYVKHPDLLHLDELLGMAKERDLRGTRLSAITIVSTEAFAPPKEVFQLRKHMSHVEYKFDDAPPEWDALSC